MELGMIGLGRMGANMVERLLRGGHRVAGHDRDAAAVSRTEKKARLEPIPWRSSPKSLSLREPCG